MSGARTNTSDANDAEALQRKATGLRVGALTMGVGAAVLFILGTLFLLGTGFEQNQMLGIVMVVMGFVDLGIAWFFLNKSVNLS